MPASSGAIRTPSGVGSFSGFGIGQRKDTTTEDATRRVIVRLRCRMHAQDMKTLRNDRDRSEVLDRLSRVRSDR